MNIVYPNLHSQLCEKSITFADLAKTIGVDLTLLEKKMQGLIPWQLHEVIKICIRLKRSDAEFLFVQLDNNTY